MSLSAEFRPECLRRSLFRRLAEELEMRGPLCLRLRCRECRLFCLAERRQGRRTRMYERLCRPCCRLEWRCS